MTALGLAAASLSASACSDEQRTYRDDPQDCEDSSNCAGSGGQAGVGNSGGSSAEAGGTGEGGATGGSSGAGGTSGTSGGSEASGGESAEGGAAGGEAQGEAGSGGAATEACVSAECDAPPSPQCTDANTLLVYAESGECVEDQCSYPSSSSHCAAGCTVDACDGDEWIDLAATNRPGSRHSHSAVWTGTEMIVWGGAVGAPAVHLSDGGRFSPTRPDAEAWIPLTSTNAPSTRSDHTAVWTGDTMIVWGGTTYESSGSVLGTGSRYTAAGGWNSVTGSGAPAARTHHTAVWTGTEMIVWGGFSTTAALASGGRYNPTTNQWGTAPTGTGAPSARFFHTAVWTGTEMIIWGGNGNDTVDPTPLNTGARYNPTTNQWTAVSTTNAPSARFYHSAVWTGTEMIVWGGDGTSDGTAVPLDSGARYNPNTNTWTALPSQTARRLHTAAWTGTEMIVWGGLGPSGNIEAGARYDLANNDWTLLPVGPLGRNAHTAVWTGSELIVYGGAVGGPGTSSGGRYVR